MCVVLQLRQESTYSKIQSGNMSAHLVRNGGHVGHPLVQEEDLQLLGVVGRAVTEAHQPTLRCSLQHMPHVWLIHHQKDCKSPLFCLATFWSAAFTLNSAFCAAANQQQAKQLISICANICACSKLSNGNVQAPDHLVTCATLCPLTI